MKHFVAKISKKITTRRNESYFNRLNWNIFLNRLENVFNEFKELDSTKNIGYFYLHTNAQVFRNDILVHARVNQAQISIGNNRLPFHTLNTSTEEIGKYSVGSERGASLVFSQFVNGKISILLYPQKSDFMSEKRDYLLLAWNKNPDDLTENKIKKYIKIYLKHIYATSVYTAFDYSNYIHRAKVMFIHYLTTRLQEFEIGKFLVGLFTILGAIAAIISINSSK